MFAQQAVTQNAPANAQPNANAPLNANANAPVNANEASATAQASACPSGMALVSGMHCPVVEHRCLRWLDPPGKWRFFRCAEYAQEATCKGERVEKHFCIDVDEQGATATDP